MFVILAIIAAVIIVVGGVFIILEIRPRSDGRPKMVDCPRCRHPARIGKQTLSVAVRDQTATFEAEGYKCGWCAIKFFDEEQGKIVSIRSKKTRARLKAA